MKKPEKISVRLLFPAKQVIATQIIAFIHSHPQSTWFHQQPVIGCFPNKKQHHPLLFVATTSDDVLGIVVAMHIHNQPYHSRNLYPSRIQANGSPLIKPDIPEKDQMLSLLLEEVINYSEKAANVIEFRNSHDTSLDMKTWLHQGFLYDDHLNLIKKISHRDNLWNELGNNRRRQIIKATHNETKIKIAENEQQVESLYFILDELYQKKIKKVLPPFNFFLDFFKLCQKQEKGVILLALKEEQIIGGIVCPIQGKKVMYEWYVCGLDKVFPYHHPSVMVTWHALLYACNNGIQTFDFMGLGKPGIPYGVRDFKLRFGGDIINYGRYSKIFR